MTHDQILNWEHFQRNYFSFPKAGLALDLSKMQFPDNFWEEVEPRLQSAYEEMDRLESGAIANRDENRMVGHYWLRNPKIAPSSEIRESIEGTLNEIKAFANKIHTGEIRGDGGLFTELLLIGIGGSALGPQFVSNALSQPRRDKMGIHFFDNTDPDGMARVIATIGSRLSQTLCIVVSKSGGTKETRNGMLEAQNAFAKSGLSFTHSAVAITQSGSELDKIARTQGWISTFPMWDWVGGRTSETSAVGLLPAALQGFDIDGILAGAAACDEQSRSKKTSDNPAALLAASWLAATGGKGEKNMVILPYKDRLELLSKYLQQLIMESLGKKLDRRGLEVFQGITVFGNKGATDQHSYIQQLKDGIPDFFATFVEVLGDGECSSLEVEKGVTSGDFLQGFLLGTRAALAEANRQSITISIPNTSPFTVGSMIALFERAVGFYASMLNINAYHQPGVESGKAAAGRILILNQKLMHFMKLNAGNGFIVSDLHRAISYEGSVEEVFKLCERFAHNPFTGIAKMGDGFTAKYFYRS